MDRGPTTRSLQAKREIIVKLIEKTTTPALSAADVAAHEAATHYRRPASKAEQIDAAYIERERQRRAMVTAERAAAGAL